MNQTRWHGEAAAAGVMLMSTTVVADAADGIALKAAPLPDPAHVEAVAQLMADLEAESAVDAARIRAACASAVPHLAIATRAALEQALAGSALLSLPADVAARCVRVRLTGRHPIGEADRAHQHLYVGARREVVGLLLEVASRVSSGPLKVTSLAVSKADGATAFPMLLLTFVGKAASDVIVRRRRPRAGAPLACLLCAPGTTRDDVTRGGWTRSTASFRRCRLSRGSR